MNKLRLLGALLPSHCQPWQWLESEHLLSIIPGFRYGFMGLLKTELRRFQTGTVYALLGAAMLGATTAQAATDLFQLSLEELLSMEITSVSKKGQPLSEAAAAIYVITQDDIRRSGMTTIPELLRMVPGLHVAQIDANKWAISSRGFNGRWANKLLVLIDGRSLYTPLFSGVYWDIQDTLLEDIERIEVIRGPGGSLWGANAVNGVINIITKHSRDTQGGLVTARAGNGEKSASMRHGSALGGNGWFRAYAKTVDHDNFVDSNEDDSYDDWNQQRAGFRADWEPTTQDTLTLQGDIYKGDSNQETGYLADLLSTATFEQDTIKQDGGNLLFRWRRTLEEGSEFELQTYFDHAERKDITLGQKIDTFDLDLQHRFQATEFHEISWGLGYRIIDDDIDSTFTVSFDPATRHTEVYSAFIQDEIRLRDNLRLTMGSKFEHNDFTGFEYQPSARLLWLASQEHTFWGALSRAVRTPARTDEDIRINIVSFSSPFVDPDGPGPLPVGATSLLSILGNKQVKSEEVIAFELGYRGQPRSDISLDISAFYNDYDNLVTGETSFLLETTPAPDHALIARSFDNQLQGVSYGLELVTSWQVNSNWRLHGGYTWQKLDMKLDSTSTDVNNAGDREDTNPEQQFQLRSHWDINDKLELDVALYFVDSIKPRDSTGLVNVPSYERLDMRIAWQPEKNLELSLAGQNLLDDQHPEYFSSDISPTEVPRTLYAQIKYLFE